MICTTLNKIREHAACADGWQKLLAGLNKAGPDDEPLPLVRILDINGIDDALWALRATDCDREARLLAVAYARLVQHLMTDARSIAALDVAERYANEQASAEELIEARASADAAWNDAVLAARASADAALAFAWASAWAAWAACGAVRDIARAAAIAARDASNAAMWAADAAADAAAVREEQVELFKEILG